MGATVSAWQEAASNLGAEIREPAPQLGDQLPARGQAGFLGIQDEIEAALLQPEDPCM